jgi:hypothetical protein
MLIDEELVAGNFALAGSLILLRYVIGMAKSCMLNSLAVCRWSPVYTTKCSMIVLSKTTAALYIVLGAHSVTKRGGILTRVRSICASGLE